MIDAGPRHGWKAGCEPPQLRFDGACQLVLGESLVAAVRADDDRQQGRDVRRGRARRIEAAREQPLPGPVVEAQHRRGEGDRPVAAQVDRRDRFVGVAGDDRLQRRGRDRSAATSGPSVPSSWCGADGDDRAVESERLGRPPPPRRGRLPSRRRARRRPVAAFRRGRRPPAARAPAAARSRSVAGMTKSLSARRAGERAREHVGENPRRRLLGQRVQRGHAQRRDHAGEGVARAVRGTTRRHSPVPESSRRRGARAAGSRRAPPATRARSPRAPTPMPRRGAGCRDTPRGAGAPRPRSDPRGRASAAAAHTPLPRPASLPRQLSIRRRHSW